MNKSTGKHNQNHIFENKYFMITRTISFLKFTKQIFEIPEQFNAHTACFISLIPDLDQVLDWVDMMGTNWSHAVDMTS